MPSTNPRAVVSEGPVASDSANTSSDITSTGRPPIGDFPNLSTPDQKNVETLVVDCHDTGGAIGVVSGTNGTGKTEALKAVVRRWPSLGLEGSAFYFRANAIRGHTRGLKDLLEGLGRKQSGANSTGSVDFAIRLLRHELERQKIRALLIDEADLWGPDGLSALVGLFDACQEAKKPVTLVLASAVNADSWIGAIRAGRSRSLRTVEMTLLSVSTMTGVLKAWGFTLFAEAVANGDTEAAKVASRLQKHTGGVFRRLAFFAALHRRHCPGDMVDQQSLETIILKLAVA